MLGVNRKFQFDNLSYYWILIFAHQGKFKLHSMTITQVDLKVKHGYLTFHIAMVSVDIM